MSAIQTTGHPGSYDVAILGAGYAGLMAALRLGHKRRGLRIALVGSRDPFLERVRLQETIVAAVAPRIASISAFVAGTNVDFIRGRVASLDADGRRIRIMTDAQEREIAFDQAIYALARPSTWTTFPARQSTPTGSSPATVRVPPRRCGRCCGKTRIGRCASSRSAAPRQRSRSRARSRPPGRAPR
jgi:hypothetical protein